MSNLDWIAGLDECELAYFLNQWATSSKTWQRDPGETLCWLQSECDDGRSDLSKISYEIGGIANEQRSEPPAVEAWDNYDRNGQDERD